MGRKGLIERFLFEIKKDLPKVTSFGPSTLFPVLPGFTQGGAENLHRSSVFLHENRAVMTSTLASEPNPGILTALQGLSALPVTFSRNTTPTLTHWTEELERAQRLARSRHPTVLAIAQGKLLGVARDWHGHGQDQKDFACYSCKKCCHFGSTVYICQYGPLLITNHKRGRRILV